MSSDRIHVLEEEVAALKEANDSLYRQHANEKAQMQLAIEQEKLQVQALQEANAAFQEENDQWRQSYDALEYVKRESEDAWEASRNEMQERITSLEESVKTYTSELVNDLQEIEKERSEIAARDESIAELQRQLNESSDRFSQLMTEYDGANIALQQQASDAAARQQQFNTLEAQLRERIGQLETQIADQAAQIADHQSRLQAMTKDDEVKEVNQHALLKHAQQEAADKDTEIAQLTQKITQLEEEVSLLSLTGGAGSDGKRGGNVLATLRDLQQQLFEKSEELVQQGERHLQIASNFEKQKEQLQSVQQEVEAVRSTLLKGIIGDDVDEAAYRHVKLGELVRLRLKSVENELRVLNGTKRSSSSYTAGSMGGEQEPAEDAEGDENTERPSTHLANVESFSAVDSFGAAGRLERELRLAKSRNKRLQSHIEQLEREVDAAMANLSEFQALKEKMVDIVGRERVEKELRVKAETNYKEATDKIMALSEHIEKLMVHLKHEAAAKTKAVDLQRRTDRELTECKEKLAVLTKKNTIKDQQIQELEHGAKILEDQLRLMDEKFIDVRNKLDWTRATSQKETKRLQGELNALRMKWQMASDMGALAALPDWVNTPKLKPKTKPLGSSSSESRLPSSAAITTSNNAIAGSNSASLSPLRGHSTDPLAMRFDIPKLPQQESDAGTPWSDAKLHGLQRQLQDKRRM